MNYAIGILAILSVIVMVAIMRHLNKKVDDDYLVTYSDSDFKGGTR